MTFRKYFLRIGLLLFPMCLTAVGAVRLPVKSPYIKVLSELSPIQDQGDRNTCTTFSSAAHLEHQLLRQGLLAKGLNISEQWLQIINSVRNSQEESTAIGTLFSASLYGVLSESELPYSTKNWDHERPLPSQTANDFYEARKTCDHLQYEPLRAQCLWAHFDVSQFANPQQDLSKMIESARQFQPQVLNGQATYLTYEQMKKALAAGETVVLDIDFYFGAWNHPGATALKIPRNEKQWRRGIVGYPMEGSLDDRSLNKPSGHSVLLVGYDDSKTTKIQHQMLNGRRQIKIHKGVFVIRNSQVSQKFGDLFEIDGKKFPGYGTITQDYVREYGVFVQYKLNQ